MTFSPTRTIEQLGVVAAAANLSALEAKKHYAGEVAHQLRGWVGKDAPRQDAAAALDVWVRRHGLDDEIRDRVLSFFEPRRMPVDGSDWLDSARGTDSKDADADDPTGDVRQMVVFKVRRDGGHVKVRVWAGQENSPGLCGDLTMRPGEWHLLCGHLDADAVGKSQCQIRYEDDEAQMWLAEVAR